VEPAISAAADGESGQGIRRLQQGYAAVVLLNLSIVAGAILARTRRRPNRAANLVQAVPTPAIAVGPAVNKLTIAVFGLLLVCAGGLTYSLMPGAVRPKPAAELPLPPLPPHFVIVSLLYEDGNPRMDQPDNAFDLAGCQAEAQTINARWRADDRLGVATCKWVEP
jgi:hypothetical protein